MLLLSLPEEGLLSSEVDHSSGTPLPLDVQHRDQFPKGRLVAALDRITSITSALGIVGSGLILFGMAWLITIDVLARYFLGRPTQVAFELSGYGLVAMAFFGAAGTQRAERHIEITALIGYLPRGVQAILAVLTTALAMAFFAWLAWATALLAAQNFHFNATSVTPLRFPLWIPTAVVPLGLGFLAIQLLLDLIAKAAALKDHLLARPQAPADRAGDAA